MSFSQNNHDSPTKPNKDDIESIKLYIQSDEDLYHDVLNYIVRFQFISLSLDALFLSLNN